MIEIPGLLALVWTLVKGLPWNEILQWVALAVLLVLVLDRPSNYKMILFQDQVDKALRRKQDVEF
jgi:hypothetical protein